jgi:uncharacterized protein YlxW (UPF0749 family)
MAKRNREKKKQHLQNLEKENAALKSQVAELLREKQDEAAHKQTLLEEIEQLKRTIQQAEPIAKVLSTLASCASVSFGIENRNATDSKISAGTTIPIQVNLQL